MKHCRTIIHEWWLGFDHGQAWIGPATKGFSCFGRIYERSSIVNQFHLLNRGLLTLDVTWIPLQQQRKLTAGNLKSSARKGMISSNQPSFPGLGRTGFGRFHGFGRKPSNGWLLWQTPEWWSSSPAKDQWSVLEGLCNDNLAWGSFQFHMDVDLRYPLVICYSLLWKMSIYSGFPIKHGDFPELCNKLPEGKSHKIPWNQQFPMVFHSGRRYPISTFAMEKPSPWPLGDLTFRRKYASCLHEMAHSP